MNYNITELEDYMRKAIRTLSTFLLAAGIATCGSLARAQDVPSDYQQVLKLVGKSGDYKANVLKVNIPRNDLHVTIADYPVPTPFGFGGWFAMTKGDSGGDVMMGDLVLLQEEVNPVMSALLEHGLEVTACTITFSGFSQRSSSCTFTVTAKPWTWLIRSSQPWTSLDMRRPPQRPVTPPQVLQRKPC
jgi:hypothetical protein